MEKISSSGNEKHDPMKASPVPERLDLDLLPKKFKYEYNSPSGDRKKADWNVWQEKQSGDKYLEKDVTLKPNQQNPQVEYFISLLSKGILHSSDFIKKDGKYLSRGMPLEAMEPVRKGELEAEFFLLEYLFNDWDKEVSHGNVRINDEGKFAHYDYAEGFRSDRRIDFSYKTDFDTQMLFEDLERDLNTITKYGQPWGSERKAKDTPNILKNPEHRSSPEIELEVLQKAKELAGQIQDIEFLNAIIKKSELNINDKRFSFLKGKSHEERIIELQKALLERLQILITLVKKRNSLLD